MVQIVVVFLSLLVQVASGSGPLRHPQIRALTAWYSKDLCTGKFSNDKASTQRLEDCKGTGNSTGGVIETGSEGIGNGTGSASGLVCDLVNGRRNANKAAKPFIVEYWYATENTDNTTDYLPILEEKIFRIASENLHWCFARDSNNTNVLIPMNTTQSIQARQNGIFGVISDPNDIKVDIPCPFIPRNEGSGECIVHQGKLTLFVSESDDINSTISLVQSTIKDLMSSNVLLGEDIPTVTRVIYLGETEPPPVDSSKKSFATIISVSSAALALLLLLLLWKRRKTTTAAEERGLEAVAASGDREGSFHLGHYHYTGDGEKYLSTNCSFCLDTAKSLRAGYGLAAINENKEMDDFDLCLVTANSKDLGGKCSAMNVVPCKSAFCEHCKLESSGVNFVPAFKYKKGHSSTIQRERPYISI